MNKIFTTLSIVCITFKLFSMEGSSSTLAFSCEAKRQELTAIKGSFSKSLREMVDFNQKVTEDDQKFSPTELKIITITQEVLPTLPFPTLSILSEGHPELKLLLEIEEVSKTMVPFSLHIHSLAENAKVDQQSLESLGTALHKLIYLHKEVSKYQKKVDESTNQEMVTIDPELLSGSKN